jgi:hypothetical protein
MLDYDIVYDVFFLALMHNDYQYTVVLNSFLRMEKNHLYQ